MTGPAHAIPGRRAVAEALRADRPLDRVLVERGADVPAILDEAGRRGVPVETVDRDRLRAIVDEIVHQGVVACAPTFRYRDLPSVDADLVVLLDGITDPQNLGAIARSAEAAGAGAIVLPKRRSVHVTPAAEKAAAGAFSWIDVVLVPNLASALATLAEKGLWSVGLEGQAGRSIWEEPLLEGPVVLVVGAEGRGLSRLVAERCDALAAIPLGGRVASLNASAAAAIALFEIRRRREGTT